jgi:hypothetical protein
MLALSLSSFVQIEKLCSVNPFSQNQTEINELDKSIFSSFTGFVLTYESILGAALQKDP